MYLKLAAFVATAINAATLGTNFSQRTLPTREVRSVCRRGEVRALRSVQVILDRQGNCGLGSPIEMSQVADAVRPKGQIVPQPSLSGHLCSFTRMRSLCKFLGPDRAAGPGQIGPRPVDAAGQTEVRAELKF
jgi:hypothetical protein